MKIEQKMQKRNSMGGRARLCSAANDGAKQNGLPLIVDDDDDDDADDDDADNEDADADEDADEASL
jgi:hypothetical protein